MRKLDGPGALNRFRMAQAEVLPALWSTPSGQANLGRVQGEARLQVGMRH